MKQLIVMAIAAGILAVTSAQQSYAQYGDSGTGVAAETLQKCTQLKIPRTQCNEYTVLQAERIELSKTGQGSGTSMLATETSQMVAFIGVLGAIFGGVAGAFYAMGRKAKQVPA
ncbi:MAG TPA: hypothetical protein VGJ42_02520 [Nitrososphaera sp.]|jgi:hypothetical protein